MGQPVNLSEVIALVQAVIESSRSTSTASTAPAVN